MSIDNMVNYQSMVNDTLAILVMNNTKLEHSESFMLLRKNLKNSGSKMDIVRYNSPESVYEKETGFENWNIHYIYNRSNTGVGKLYNEGSRIGKKLNKNSALFVPVLTANNKIVSFWRINYDPINYYGYSCNLFSG